MRCMLRARRTIDPPPGETRQIGDGPVSQTEAARKWRVDVSTVIGIRRTFKDAALAAPARWRQRRTLPRLRKRFRADERAVTAALRTAAESRC